jgi:hypothetical protein
VTPPDSALSLERARAGGCVYDVGDPCGLRANKRRIAPILRHRFFGGVMPYDAAILAS